MKTVTLVLAIAMAFPIAAATAQTAVIGKKDNRELLRLGLYPPDILMRRQQELGITSEQRAEIAAQVRKFQEEVTELQWDMPAEQQKLQQILGESAIEPDKALAQAARVMEMETQFKLAHFKMLIAIKNTLTDGQIDMINSGIRRRLSQD